MPYCTRLLNSVLRSLLLLCLLSGGAAAHADGIAVNKAELRLSEEGYQLMADFDVNLNFVVQQALARGVPIYFVSEFTLTRSRWYWLDEQVTKNELTTKLSYSVLTRQYRISRGSLFQNFDSLENALLILQRQSSAMIPLELINSQGNYIPKYVRKYINKDINYVAGVRLTLDIGQLPKLLQVNAWTSQDWDLDSGWYRWVVNTGEAVPRSEPTPEDAQ